MPRVDGWQVLTAMRSDEELRAILHRRVEHFHSLRVDKDRAYSLGATHYITKPFTFDALVIAVRSGHIGNFSYPVGERRRVSPNVLGGRWVRPTAPA